MKNLRILCTIYQCRSLLPSKGSINRQQEGNVTLERDWLPQWLNKENIMGMVLKNLYDIGTIERYELAQELINKN